MLTLVCVGCVSGVQLSQTGSPARGASFHEARPRVVCLPPRPPVDALTAGPYALCAEYRSGRIEAREYSTALAGYGEMLVAMAALDTLDDPSAATISARAEVVARLRQNATLRTLCAAPSLAPFGNSPSAPCSRDQRARPVDHDSE